MIRTASVDTVARHPESAAARSFLDRVLLEPAALVIEGEAGIGKTTLLRLVANDAAAQGFRVFSTRGAPTEVQYAFAGVADLLRDVAPDVLADLPEVQRDALSSVLVLSDGTGRAAGERVVAAAFLSVMQLLAAEAPLLLCIDDSQWLDTSSQMVIGFAVRRFAATIPRIGIVAAVRTGADTDPYLDLLPGELTQRLRMGPLSLGGVHKLIVARLGHALPRPTLSRIYEISGGNPFFALELARSADEDRGATALPHTLAAVVQQRIGEPDDELATVLLATACAMVPSVERVGRVVGMSADQVVELIESAHDRGLLELDGNRIRFVHPLYANGVYASASPGRRRAMHRRLAGIVDEPEIKARHLALSATTADDVTLKALDVGAAATRERGAPAQAAELIELAIKLGGDTPVRRLRAAHNHFRSGALSRTRALMQSVFDESAPGSAMRCMALVGLASVTAYDTNLVTGYETLARAVEETGDYPVLQLQARLLLVAITPMVGRLVESVEHARIAVSDAERLGMSELHGQALSAYVVVNFMAGHGVDRPALQMALQLENPDSDVTSIFQATAAAAVIAARSGALDHAAGPMRDIYRRYVERGTEIDILWAAGYCATIDIGLGRYAEAAATADEVQQRAEQLSCGHVLVSGFALQATVAAYTGSVGDARSAARSAIDAARNTGYVLGEIAPLTTLGFVEVSLGDYPAALQVLAPLLNAFDPTQDTELLSAAYLPDAVEALTASGRLDEAEPLITALEYAGAQHDRPWALALGKRSRSLWLAADGQLAAAEGAAQAAMEHHRRLPMPFEAARTQLLLGQLQRRRRRRQAAEVTLGEALATFERLGAPLWAQRARAELDRMTPSSGGDGRLTLAERRVAERAAKGMSNKEIAADLFIAAKTVEMNLSTVYRKLGIRSRAALSAALADHE